MSYRGNFGGADSDMSASTCLSIISGRQINTVSLLPYFAVCLYVCLCLSLFCLVFVFQCVCVGVLSYFPVLSCLCACLGVRLLIGVNECFFVSSSLSLCL